MNSFGTHSVSASPTGDLSCIKHETGTGEPFDDRTDWRHAEVRIDSTQLMNWFRIL